MQPRPQLSARAEGAWMKACKHRTKIGDVDDGSKPCPALHKRVGKVQSEGNGGGGNATSLSAGTGEESRQTGL